jgi:hypothetical protein
MAWRVLLTALYAGVLGALMALDNSVDVPDALWLIAWLAAPVVGFLVGRWWAILAVVGAIVGRTIGWDPSENDGNPALWLPYLVTIVLLIGLPLLLGAICSYVWRARRWLSADGG